MKTVRKFLSLFLSICIASYTIPASTTAGVDQDYVKVELSDEEMSEAVGASGSLDVTMADYNTPMSKATAVLANRTSLVCNYSMDVVNGSSGAIIENLASGSLAQGQATLISGTPTIAPCASCGQYIQTQLWHAGVPGLLSKDSSGTFN